MQDYEATRQMNAVEEIASAAEQQTRHLQSLVEQGRLRDFIRVRNDEKVIVFININQIAEAEFMAGKSAKVYMNSGRNYTIPAGRPEFQQLYDELSNKWT